MRETWQQMQLRHQEERDALIVQALKEAGGNSHEAARQLGMNLSHMRKRVAERGLRDRLQWTS